MRGIRLILITAALASAALQARAALQREMMEMRSWTDAAFGSGAGQLPFSFVCDGKRSAELLGRFRFTKTSRKLDSCRTQLTFTWTDPASRLQVKCVVVRYNDFPVVEWTLHLKNAGRADTPIIERIRALDSTFDLGTSENCTIHTLKGDNCSADSYEPLQIKLDRDSTRQFSAVRGRPTQVSWPYWNVEAGGRGLIVACGWPGQWSASFSRDRSGQLHVTAGQELTRFRLHPGEEVRGPLMVLLFYSGEFVDAQNLWRRWMLAHNTPRDNGRPMRPMVSSCPTAFFPGLLANEQAEREWIAKFEAEGVKLDFWWIDAGWYKCDPAIGWPQVGTWEFDPERYPNGVRPISDLLHKRGMRLILWQEPERVHAGTYLAENHPEWVSGGKASGLLDLGNHDCWRWVVEHFDRLIKEQGVDLYRQDFNIDPLDAWRSRDAEDRQGITEIKHVMGYLALWDELKKRNPGLLIDSCASGGRRNDLESLRRAVPLLRSDYQSFSGDVAYAIGNQGHTYGLSFWLPYYGQGVYWSPDHYIYSVRSYLSPAFGLCCNVRDARVNWSEVRKAADDARAVGRLMLADYYPLTPYNLDETQWMAWQFHSPSENRGFVQAFRRFHCEEDSLRVRLRGLDPDAVYEVTDRDDPSANRHYTGRLMMEGGLCARVRNRPGAVILCYRRLAAAH